MPIHDVNMLKEFYKINEKNYDKINSTGNSIHWHIQFTITTEMKQPQ